MTESQLHFLIVLPKVEETPPEEKSDDPLRPPASRMTNGSANGEERVSAGASAAMRAGVKRRLSDDADDADDEDDDEPDVKGMKGEKEKPSAVAASPSHEKEEKDSEEAGESDDRLQAEEAKGKYLR